MLKVYGDTGSFSIEGVVYKQNNDGSFDLPDKYADDAKTLGLFESKVDADANKKRIEAEKKIAEEERLKKILGPAAAKQETELAEQRALIRDLQKQISEMQDMLSKPKK
jgi:hypothetical protein